MVNLKGKYGLKLLFCLLLLLGGITVWGQNKNKVFTCRATYYHNKFENRKTSSGEVFSQKLYTAAHRTIALQTVVKVTNLRTGKSVLVKINDRCGRNGIIDMSKISADRIGLNGSEQVSIEVLGKDYIDIWQKQNEMFADSEQTAFADGVVDSLLADRAVMLNCDIFIRLATVRESETNVFLDNIPAGFRSIVKKDKVYNEDFYYIDVGPFSTQDKANSALNELKKDYPLAHLIRKKK